MSQNELLLRKIMDTKHVRSLRIERAEVPSDAGADNRTVELSFASDIPHEHFLWSTWEYVDIALSMDPKAVRTERLSAGAPLLMDHNPRDMVGVIEDFSIEKKEGKARATVRFSESVRGEEIYKDVLGGIRQCVSVGFMIHKLALKEQRDRKKGEIDLYEAQDWEPYEISIVAIPADISVGVGRSIDLGLSPEQAEAIVSRIAAQFSNKADEGVRVPSINSTSEKTMNENQNQPAPPAVEAPVQRSAADIALDAVKGWATTFRELGQTRDADTVAAYISSCARDGITPSEDGMRAALKAATPATPTPAPLPAAEAAARQGGVQLARSIPRYGRLKHFKDEQRAYRFGQFLMASVLGNAKSREFCNQNGIKFERAMGESVNETGGYLVPDEFGNDLIDLREQYGVFRRNATNVPMASDTRTDPRRAGGLTAYFVAEAGSITASDMAWDQVSLVAKKLAVLARYSSEISEDSSIAFGDTLAGEIAYAFAEKEDRCGFLGDGTSTYGGITGVTQKLLGLSATRADIAGLVVGTGNLFSELVIGDFEAVVAKLPQYADTDAAAWYVHRTFYWNVMVKAMLASGGVTAAEIEDARKQRFMGYRVEFSQVMPNTDANDQIVALFGDLAKAASFGTRRNTEIALSEHSRFANDQIEIRGTERFDINVHDVGNQSSTAASRVPGPIIGLASAAS